MEEQRLIGAQLASLEDMLEANVGGIYQGRRPDGGYMWDRAPEPREMVNHPRHYAGHPSGVECIEICEHMTFNLGNAFKYGWRYYDKGDPVENFQKMLWYLARSLSHDTSFLLGNPSHINFFRTDVMTPRRRTIFNRPSPWCEPIRHTMAALCDLHVTPGITERLRLYEKAERCIRQAITDENCLGRAINP